MTNASNFSKEWAKSVGKKRFIAHFKEIHKDVDLNKIYDTLVPSKKPVGKQ